ncbi:hypothetical protein GWG65_17435 [Bradyrhizobium sp. CSA207]|uniref:hypothetical protein n=1 Tax=Bradyrhizobium sp. CSA207 TaxID=2698826 RepID=UPI0023AE9E40|nr:hypothetical protein [Bradyrhizobium sp. CSA207]MDE5443202.1 hypothetical protein [Bradyrhizobium sp. CSA207]
MTEGIINVLDDKEDWFRPTWQGWHSYDQFVQSVKSDLRYVRSPSANGFLDEVLASCLSRKLTIPKDPHLLESTSWV